MSTYTADEVWDEDGGKATLGNDELRRLVALSLARVPAEVTDDVLEKVLFLMPRWSERGFFLPAELINERHIIGLSENLLDEEDEIAIETLLHEVAHFRLEHQSQYYGLAMEESAIQEAAASALVREWLDEWGERAGQ